MKTLWTTLRSCTWMVQERKARMDEPIVTRLRIMEFGQDTTRCKASTDLEHWAQVTYCNEMDMLLRANCKAGDEVEMLVYPYELQSDGTYASRVDLRPVEKMDLTCLFDCGKLFKEN